MQQCHANLQLATQQSDTTKITQIRAEIQTLSQQQAKLHFAMDELLTKEKKVEAGSKILKPIQMPILNNFITTVNPNNDMMEITPTQQHTMNQHESLSPQPTMIPQHSMLSHQCNTQGALVSPQSSTHCSMLSHQCHSQASAPQNTAHNTHNMLPHQCSSSQNVAISPQSISDSSTTSPQYATQCGTISPSYNVTHSTQQSIAQVHVDKEGRVIQQQINQSLVYNNNNNNNINNNNNYINYNTNTATADNSVYVNM